MTRIASRRRFLQDAASGLGGLMILPSARSAFGYQANDRLRLAVVGMAGYGAYVGFASGLHLLENVEYTVSCDVDQRKVQRVYDFWTARTAEWGKSEKAEERAAASRFYGPLADKPPPLVADFRRLFDEDAGQFDAVMVATPDHTHAIIAAAALRAGKPVMAEKPLAISAYEARTLFQLAKQCKLPTQVNTGGAAAPGFRRGVELLREGVLGDVRQVHVFFARGGRNFQATPQGSQPVPKELNWDLWLAQVKWREYHPDWINRIAWRDTSIGELGNFGPHSANMAFMGLRVNELWEAGADRGRIRVTAECSEVNQISYPRWERIHWEIPTRGSLPPVTFTWHHGYPPDYALGTRSMLESLLGDHGATDEELKKFLPQNGAGCVILGSQGLLATPSHNTEVHLLPRPKFEHVEQTRPVTLPTSPGHYKEWIHACRGGPQPISHFEYAATLAELLTVGSLATRFPGETIEFDPASGRITNHPHAAALLRYEYRPGYTI